MIHVCEEKHTFNFLFNFFKIVAVSPKAPSRAPYLHFFIVFRSFVCYGRAKVGLMGYWVASHGYGTAGIGSLW